MTNDQIYLHCWRVQVGLLIDAGFSLVRNLIGQKNKPIKARGEKNAANMVLAYEISVNDEFQMGGAEPRENTVQGQVKKTVEKAFWDILRDQMKNGDDEMVFGIIREIREQILNFLAPNSATRERIKAQLDMELIEQQWIAGTLELKVRINHILNQSLISKKRMALV